VSPAENGAELPVESVAHLASAARWARVLAWFAFICAGFLLLGAAGMAAMPSDPKLPQGTSIGSFVIGLLILIPFAALLWGYSGALRAFAGGRPAALVTAFRRLRTYWVTLAIAYAISVVFAVWTMIGTVFHAIPSK
jgi:hypothetical protein